MENQQRNSNLIYLGSVIKKEDALTIIEKYKEGFSLSKLSGFFGYNVATIRYFLIKNGLKTRNVKESVVPFHKNKIVEVDDYLHQNILGWILGDGGVRKCKNSKHAHFIYTDLKIDHIEHIKSILDSYNINYSVHQNKKSKCYYIQSEALYIFDKYYDLFYGYDGLNENGEKRKTLPNIKLTPIILKNWFIGDGSSSPYRNSYNNRGTIVCKFRNEFIINQLKDICGEVSCYKYKTKTGHCHQYYFGNKQFIKLLEYIGDCPVESYRYKWIVRRSTTIIEPS